jgi:drug/metabolite transporter (DMT)-like permease
MFKNQTIKAMTATFAAYFLWGFSFLFSRLGLNCAEPFVLLAHRFTAAAALMGLLLLTGVIRIHLRGKNILPLLTMGFFEPVLYFVGETYGILYTSTAFSGVMIATAPVFMLIASALFLREKATRSQVVWSMISIAGVVVIALQSSGEGTVTLKGFLFLVLAVLTAVSFTILSRKLSGQFSAFERTFVCMAEGAAAYWILGTVQCRGDLSQLVAPLTIGRYWISLFYLGGISSVVCYLFINYAFSYVSVNRTAAGTSLTTVISILAGVLFLHEPFSWVSFACSAVILTGIYGVQKSSAAQNKALHK